MTRNLSILGTLIVSALVSLQAAHAADPGACYVNATSRVDAILNPVRGGDEKFFTVPAGPPNVAFVLDNSGSMHDGWPVDFCTDAANANGCGCDKINNLVGYDPNELYESEIKNLSSGSFYDAWFHPDQAYEMRNWKSGAPDYGQALNSSPGGTIWTGSGSDKRASAFANACNSISGASDSLKSTCRSCLATKGYFIGDNHLSDSNNRGDWRVAGNFLNHYSPRYLMMRRVVKQVIRDIQPVRMMTATLNDNSGNAGPNLRTAWNPPCNKSDPAKDGSNFFSNRNSIVSEIDKISFKGGTPLTKALLMAGYSMQSVNKASVYDDQFGSGWATTMNISSTTLSSFQEKASANQLAICYSCTFSSVIVLTDGQPNDAYEDKVPGFHNLNDLDWSDCPECANYDLDEVAKFLWETDIRRDHDNQQKVAVYTLGFALDPTHWSTKLLRHTAQVGGGRYYGATSSKQLKKAILDIFDDINSRNTSFASASVAALQTGSEDLTAILPRMSPRKNMPWLGSLWRFSLFNEFTREVDYNSDGDQDDMFVVDQDNSIVVEDSTGGFKKAKSDGTPSSTAAVPKWEARSKLQEMGHKERKIFTVRDSSGDGSFTSEDEVLEFTPDNISKLKDYLAITGTDNCPSIAGGVLNQGRILSALGITAADAALALAAHGASLSSPVPTQSELDTLCLTTIIQYVRGQDLSDEDQDGLRTDTRESVLGDIFHSSPIQVDPPVDRFLCDMGIHNQCARTLYSEALSVAPTPLASYPDHEIPCSDDGSGAKAKTTLKAYDKYQFDYRKRETVVLVGANDGMLHAFRDSPAAKETCVEGVEELEREVNDEVGKEVWAFIPPDVLPRLFESIVQGHRYLVDGDTMVRDIWYDDDDNGKKEATEFRTMAVSSEGRGGVHYFAIELAFDTGTSKMLLPNQCGTGQNKSCFRWMFPQPHTAEAAKFGKAFFSLSPKAPPIGPVLLEKEGGEKRYDIDTEERWIAMLSGGWSPGRELGRGVYMVDIYNGLAHSERKDNLLWKFDYLPDATDEKDGPRQALEYSVAAPVALVDYGQNDTVQFDGFFDTGVFGDTGGQLWVLRFSRPGIFDEGTGLVKNWGGARAFQQDKENPLSFKNRWPFYYLPTIGLQPDNHALRAFIGTGDRYAILEENAGSCRFDNPLACAKYGCGTVKVETESKRPKYEVTRAENTWTSGSLSGAWLTESELSADHCSATTAATPYHTISSCPAESGNISFGDVRDYTVSCSTNTAGTYTCQRTDANPEVLNDLAVVPTSTMLNSLGLNRFYSVWVYGRDPKRVFDEAAETEPSEDDEVKTLTAGGYDAVRIGDRSGELANVTNSTCDANGKCTGNQGTPSGRGWFFEYQNAYDSTFTHAGSLSHKSAGGAALIASCTLWNTLHPITVTTMCGSSSYSKGRFHQAHFITGLPNCAASFKGETEYSRFLERDVLAPPPEPATAIQISKSGKVRYSTLIVEPGQKQATTISVQNAGDVLQSVYELPVTRDLHECRHTEGGHCKTAAP